MKNFERNFTNIHEKLREMLEENMNKIRDEISHILVKNLENFRIKYKNFGRKYEKFFNEIL